MPVIDPRDWIADDPDPATRSELSALSPDQLAERFAENLHFGTAGLRGPVRAGPNGMNVAVVTRATWALGQWLIDHGHRGARVVVGRDARHGSRAFAKATAEVLAAQGFDVIVLAGTTPTPLVAFACRDTGAMAAVAVTASHNPPADNGYKVYVDGGAQIIPPADREIERLIESAPGANTVARQPVSPDDRSVRNTARYLDRLVERFGRVATPRVRIALTALHGVGGRIAVSALRRACFDDIHVVAGQFAPNPDFPTVAFPNPEEPGATDQVLALAQRVDADIAIALDPDADRCAIGTRVHGRWRMLTGDETGALLGAHLLATTTLTNPVVASTIVSGSLLAAVAASAGARHVTTLTGFKWLVRAGEPLLYAYEEAIGHCVDPAAVRDKDGIGAAVVAAMLTRHRVAMDSDLSAALDDLAVAHGVHVTAGRSIRVTDLDEITDLMAGLRRAPPTRLAGVAVGAHDYATRTDELRTDAVRLTGACADGTTVRVIARPSGTEPKLKYYIEVVAPPGRPDVEETTTRLRTLAADIAAALPDRSR
ncbi:phospho-sugar mutase [Gordonia rhizosphera]|uniref:Putative phosphoglucomutase n=1 Tax=Gordonia rhizosphera NBRC 16068 TaxID=1108045 RepID=K6WPB9_9ACTN|nr:phospho-sugar mutase [Gordonia rhizosphera]GAB88364.1 putative phosphoglucomutase [Gordonia rhizosphera NBRC 16068]